MFHVPSWAVASAIALTALASAGCQVPTSHTTMGWRFEVGRPATMSTPAAINQGSSTLAVMPLAAAAAPSPPRAAVLAAEAPACTAEQCPPCPPSTGLLRRGSLAAVATTPACDLNDLCARLERIERRLSSTPANEPAVPRQLPAGPPSQQQP